MTSATAFWLCRALQWALPPIVLVTSTLIHPAIAVAMITAAWAAKKRADTILAQAIVRHNMSHYIRRGGLHKPLHRITLPRI